MEKTNSFIDSKSKIINEKLKWYDIHISEKQLNRLTKLNNMDLEILLALILTKKTITKYGGINYNELQKSLIKLFNSDVIERLVINSANLTNFYKEIQVPIYSNYNNREGHLLNINNNINKEILDFFFLN